MATIIEQKKEKKVVSYKFVVCLGRENGKKIYRSTTWKPPQGLSYAKARKMAEIEAYQWEQELRGKGDQLRGEFTNIPEPAVQEPVASAKPEPIKEQETFRYFAEQI